MLRQILTTMLLLAAGTIPAENVAKPRTTFLGTSPLFLAGMVQPELEQELNTTSGMFVQGRWFVPYTDGLFAGGQVAWRYHFRTLARGLFVGPYVDMNWFDFSATKSSEPDYKANILVVGGQWGGRYTFDGGGFIGFRIGAGIPVMTDFERKYTGIGIADTVSDYIDRLSLRPALIAYSVVDASLSFGYAF